MADKPVSTSTTALIENTAGAYKILPGGAAFCSGIIPYEGYEVVRVLLRPWIALEQGYGFIESYLKSVGRPIQAFCGIELRVPAPLAMSDWSTFNVPYLEQLRKWGLIFGDYSGVCRSNIALALHPPAATSLCAFSYTAPASAKSKTFFLSGQADIDASGKAIAEGDTGPTAMQRRARYTIDTVGATLAKLGVSWQDTTQIAFFHAHEIPDLWGAQLLGSLGEALRGGVLVYRARPPIAGLEVELEARALRQELVVATS
jgi:enamine deaminase RidA (YjgF/YER057c/UK114 family)